MTDLKLNDVNLVLVDHRSQVRNSLRMALNDAGLKNNNIKDGADLQTISEALQVATPPDILICDTGLKGGDVFRMLSAIRHNEIGNNPFIAIIAISWDPTAKLVDQFAGSGADYLVAAPFSPQQIIDRIRAIVYNRTPFVVTSDYIGPDRRDPGRGAELPLIEVPNSLRAKVLGEYNFRLMNQAIEQTLGTINECKMDRHALTLAENAATLAYDYTIKDHAVDPRRVEALSRACSDLRRRAFRAKMNHVAELCEALQNVIQFVRTTPPDSLAKEIELMKQLSFAIRGAVDLREEGSTVIHDIASSINARGGKPKSEDYSELGKVL